MRWQRVVGAALVIGSTTLGCESTHSLSALGTKPSALVLAGDSGTIRSQKPEGDGNPPVQPPPGQLVASLRATVNGVPILDTEVREAAIGMMRELLRVSAGDRAREEQKLMDMVLDQIIDRELLYQDALAKLRRAGKRDVYDKIKEAADKDFQRWLRAAKGSFSSDEEFKAYLSSVGTTIEGQRRSRERLFIAEEYLRSNVMRFVDHAASPSEILDYYRGHPEEFTRADSVQWLDIFILASKFPTREEARRFAETLAERARSGEDFVTLCRQHDDGLAKDQQGAGIGTERGKIRPPEVEPAIFALKPGEVGPIVDVNAGFHVIKVAKREYAGIMAFDDKVQLQVRDKIRNEVYIKERKRFLEELRRNSQIEKIAQR